MFGQSLPQCIWMNQSQEPKSTPSVTQCPKKKKKKITSVLVMSAVAQWKTWQFLTPSAVVQGHGGGHWNEEQKKKRIFPVVHEHRLLLSLRRFNFHHLLLAKISVKKNVFYRTSHVCTGSTVVHRDIYKNQTLLSLTVLWLVDNSPFWPWTENTKF